VARKASVSARSPLDAHTSALDRARLGVLHVVHSFTRG
jgi:hypothetical protein